MITQITARPDPDGIIRVRCGNDMIEITLDPTLQPAAQQEGRAAKSSAKTPPKSAPVPGPAKPPEALPERTEKRWSKLPDWKRIHTFYSVGLGWPPDPSSPGYLTAATQICMGVTAARADATRTDPEAILLKVKGGLDIHGITHLSEVISMKDVDLPIFIEFERP